MLACRVTHQLSIAEESAKLLVINCEFVFLCLGRSQLRFGNDSVNYTKLLFCNKNRRM